MSLKNFMLGFGCGLITLAAILFFYIFTQADAAEPVRVEQIPMSDERVIARAKDLGMVEYAESARLNAAETDASAPEIIYVEVKRNRRSTT